MLAAENLRDTYQFRKAQDALVSSMVQRQKDLLTLARDTAAMENLDKEVALENTQRELQLKETTEQLATADDRFGANRLKTQLDKLKAEEGISTFEEERDLRALGRDVQRGAFQLQDLEQDVAKEISGTTAAITRKKAGQALADLTTAEQTREERERLDRLNLLNAYNSALNVKETFDEVTQNRSRQLQLEGIAQQAQLDTLNRVPSINEKMSGLSTKLTDPDVVPQLKEIATDVAALPDGHPTKAAFNGLTSRFEAVQQRRAALMSAVQNEFNRKTRTSMYDAGLKLLEAGKVKDFDDYLVTLPLGAEQKLRLEQDIERRAISRDLKDSYAIPYETSQQVELGKLKPVDVIKPSVEAFIARTKEFRSTGPQAQGNAIGLSKPGGSMYDNANQPKYRLPDSAEDFFKVVEQSGPMGAKQEFGPLFNSYVDSLVKLNSLRTSAMLAENRNQIGGQTPGNGQDTAGGTPLDEARRRAAENAAKRLAEATGPPAPAPPPAPK